MTNYEAISSSLSLAALVAVIFVTYRSIEAQRRLSKLTALANLSIQMNDILAKQPVFLELHGITESELQAKGLSTQEFLYILTNMRAGEVYHRIEDATKIELSQYRMIFMSHPKVQQAWSLIRGRLMTEGPYSRAIDKHFKALPQNTPSQVT